MVPKSAPPLALVKTTFMPNTCRRLLGHHDAEDAFQTTFIVLVKKADSVAPREMVGNWLYGVACRTAAGPSPTAESAACTRKRRSSS